MQKITRRSFIQSTAAGAVLSSFAISGTRVSGNILGANDRIRLAIAGINGRGRSLYNGFAGIPGVEVTHLVDPDTRLFKSRAAEVAKQQEGREPQCAQDLREVLDNPDVDAIGIASTNHWHALMTIWACQAGKDVYVEKPLSHNVHEGRIALEAAKRYGRIVQHGTQSRASSSWANTIAAVRSGEYGKLLVSRGHASKPRWSIGYREPESPPSGFDYNLWLGPAQEQPFHRNLVHYNWHWFWEFGNGEIGNQGVHQMDIAWWGLGEPGLPRRVFSLGGRLAYEDQAETPNTQMAVYEHDDVLLVFEVRGLVGGQTGLPNKVTNEFFTTEGRIENGRFFPRNGTDHEPLKKFEGTERAENIFENFIKAVRSRRSEDLYAGVSQGHYSSALCHLGNISYRLGQEATWDKRSKAFGDNKVVADTMQNIEDNLKLLQKPLEGLTYRVGRILEFNPKSERFINDPEADALLTRDYRAPFVVPEKIT